MRRATIAAMALTTAALAACGSPADTVAVPGAPSNGEVRPSTSAGAGSTSLPSAGPSTTTTPTSTTSASPSTTAAPATPSSTAAPTTVAPTAPPAPTTVPAPTTTVLVYVAESPDGPLRVGVEGPRSLQVQQQLVALGILPASGADSKYGPGTASAVRRFQESKGLVVDGVAGPNTVAALAAAVAALTPPTTG